MYFFSCHIQSCIISTAYFCSSVAHKSIWPIGLQCAPLWNSVFSGSKQQKYILPCFWWSVFFLSLVSPYPEFSMPFAFWFTAAWHVVSVAIVGFKTHLIKNIIITNDMLSHMLILFNCAPRSSLSIHFLHCLLYWVARNLNPIAEDSGTKKSTPWTKSI